MVIYSKILIPTLLIKFERPFYCSLKTLNLLVSCHHHLWLKAYQTLIQPILLYGSDVWGFSKAGCEAIDKLCLFFLRCVLRVKKSTSKLMCYGDLGVLPPSVHAHSHCILFHSRISNLPENDIVRCVQNVLHDFNEVGSLEIRKRA